MPTQAWGLLLPSLRPSAGGWLTDLIAEAKLAVVDVFVANLPSVRPIVRPPTIGAEKATKPFVKWQIRPIVPVDS